ncbi:enoyl-CoA hydratase/isomerase family protein [Rhodococcus koreensis]
MTGTIGEESVVTEDEARRFETIRYEVRDHVATIMLDRPEKLNAFTQKMVDEFRELWREIHFDDDVRVVVLRAAGDRAFCTGVDVHNGIHKPENKWSWEDPGIGLGPKQNLVWKPVICAVHGMVAGGAMYWVNESDIVIGADDTTFFDPHTSYGMVSALEPMGMARRVPIGEVLRWALLGLDERMSAERAREIGLLSEVVPRDRLWARAHELALIIAKKPTAAVQGTVKAIWDSLDMTRSGAQQVGLTYAQLGNPIGTAEVSRADFVKPDWTLR